MHFMSLIDDQNQSTQAYYTWHQDKNSDLNLDIKVKFKLIGQCFIFIQV